MTRALFSVGILMLNIVMLIQVYSQYKETKSRYCKNWGKEDTEICGGKTIE